MFHTSKCTRYDIYDKHTTVMINDELNVCRFNYLGTYVANTLLVLKSILIYHRKFSFFSEKLETFQQKLL